jgi:hypothetical protein
MSDIQNKYKHIKFIKNWEITNNSWLLLGQSEAYVKAICNTPILPEYRHSLPTIASNLQPILFPEKSLTFIKTSF